MTDFSGRLILDAYRFGVDKVVVADELRAISNSIPNNALVLRRFERTIRNLDDDYEEVTVAVTYVAAKEPPEAGNG